MIPIETLIKTISDFDKKIKIIEKNFETETLETWTLEKFQEWQKYEDALKKLEDIVEYHILPLT